MGAQKVPMRPKESPPSPCEEVWFLRTKHPEDSSPPQPRAITGTRGTQEPPAPPCEKVRLLKESLGTSRTNGFRKRVSRLRR